MCEKFCGIWANIAAQIASKPTGFRPIVNLKIVCGVPTELQHLVHELFYSIVKMQLELVRGTPTAGVLIHWVIISRRWERIQQRDSESPINTDSPRKKKCCDAVA